MSNRPVATTVWAALQAAGYRELREDSPGEISYASLDRTFQGRPVVYAGNATSLNDREAMKRSGFVVVEDHPRPAQVERLQRDAAETGARLCSLSEFCDVLWDADVALDWALRESFDREDTGLPEQPGGAPPLKAADVYVFPSLRPQDDADANVTGSVLSWVDGDADGFDQQVIVVEGDAGVGKSELVRALERRSAINYQNALNSGPSPRSLPPLALRVPLRTTDSLSVGLIRDYLLREIGLPKLTETLLIFLLKRQRLLLLLDGVDEMTISLARTHADMSVLRRLSVDGARILATTRRATLGPRSPIQVIRDAVDDLPERGVETLDLGPLEDRDAEQLLRNCGATPDEAGAIARGLPADLKGIPLFLIWSHFSGHVPSQGAKADAFIELIHGVCHRESTRRAMAHLSADEQLEHLTQMAVELEDRALTASDLENLVDADSQFVTGPHALLRIDDEGRFHFRHEAFRSVLLASGLAGYWKDHRSRSGGDYRTWLVHRMGAGQLDALTHEFLTQLLAVDDVATAWTVAAQAPARSNPFLRHNLLLIALAKVHETATASLRRLARPTPADVRRAHTGALGAAVPDHDLSGCHIDRLVFSQFDFAGWKLTELRGEDATFQHCNFAGAEVDESIFNYELEQPLGLTAGGGAANQT